MVLSDAGERLLAAVGRGGSCVALYLADDAEIHRINRKFRHVDRATDVLSFPAVPDEVEELELGEIMISVETARRQAREGGQALMERLVDLLAHGILHLLGFDHHGKKRPEWGRMEARLRGVRAELKRELRRGGPGKG